MNTMTVSLDLPRDLLGALDVPPIDVEQRLRELIALGLFRDGRISSGKGAELIGISKMDFIRLLTKNGISYFTQTPEELQSEISALEKLFDTRGA